MFGCVWPRYRLNALIDLNKILHPGILAQTLRRDRQWAKSLDPFQDGGHFKYLNIDKS